jgi:hypothetical protein
MRRVIVVLCALVGVSLAMSRGPKDESPSEIEIADSVLIEGAGQGEFAIERVLLEDPSDMQLAYEVLAEFGHRLYYLGFDGVWYGPSPDRLREVYGEVFTPPYISDVGLIAAGPFVYIDTQSQPSKAFAEAAKADLRRIIRARGLTVRRVRSPSYDELLTANLSVWPVNPEWFP